jgi:hypothetical protein
MSEEYQPDEVLETKAMPDSAAPEITPNSSSEPQSDLPTAPTATFADNTIPMEPIEDAQAPKVSEVASNDPTTQSSIKTMTAEMDTNPSAAETYKETKTDMESSTPSVVRIADIENNKKKKSKSVGRSPKLSDAFSKIGRFFIGRAWLVGGIFVVLLLIFLLLPPVSLGSRLVSNGGYTTLNAETPSLSHADGLTVSIDPQAESKINLKLGSVPRLDFMGDAIPKELQPARDTLPDHIVPKSPYYTLETRNKTDSPTTIAVVIPNEAEPWETLDLYTWNGESWQWLSSHLDRDAEILTTKVLTLPRSLMVMQSEKIAQRVIAEVTDVPPAELESVLTDADLTGMLIGTMGGLTGDATQLPPANASTNPILVPAVRNWLPGRAPNWTLVHDMLSIEADRANHVANLVGLTQGGGYTGLVVDYREIKTEDRKLYSDFIRTLQKALHAEGLWLAVTVDTPTPLTEGAWDTGGYDWTALGQAADQVRVVMPLAPQAYTPGGIAEQLLEWGTSKVERYKLHPIYSTLSTDGEKTLTLSEALAPLGNIKLTQTVTDSVLPGTPLNFQLGAARLDIDSNTGAGELVVGDKTLWLGTPQWLRNRLALTDRYHLGGVVIRDILDPGNLPNMIAAVADYKATSKEAGYSAIPEITWQVNGPQGQTTQTSTSLTQSQFVWTAPDITGTYQIAASVAGSNKGSVRISVGYPKPVLTETLGTAEADEEDTEDEEGPKDLKAAFVADVSVPDNTRFEKEEKFTKTWRLRNAGTDTWPKDTVLIFEQGSQMTDVSQTQVGKVAPGETVDISVEMVAPSDDGTFKSVWHLEAAGNAIPGGGVFVVIKTGEEQTETETELATTDAPAPVVAPVSSGGFELGGHVRDLALPYADKMHNAGMNWMKVQIHYGEDPAWIVNIAKANGFKIQLSALGSPNMVTEPGFEKKFADWLAGVARTGAEAIEVWNEPNIDREWQIGYISPQAYTNLLCTAYNAIKGVNPNAAVISAAPAPTGYFGGCSPNGCDDQPWMEGLYNAGAANCMDYIGAHHNAGATAPSARSGHPAGGTHHSWYFLPQTELYYNIFRGTRKIFYTEMGYASQEGLEPFSEQFAWARGINNAQQAAWLSEAVQLGINTGMVRCIIVWNIDFTRYGYDPQDGYAIVRPGGGCPACDALHNILGTR